MMLLCERIAEAGGQKPFASAVGLSEQYVSDVVNGRRGPGKSILRALGMKRLVYYIVDPFPSEFRKKRGRESQ